MDLLGAVLATAAFSCATYALSLAGDGESARVGLAAAVASAVMFALLLIQQRRAAHRLVPRALTRERHIVLGNLATALVAACFQVGIWYFLTYRMQDQRSYSPLLAGLAFIPLTATMLAVNLWLTPRLMTRLSPHLLIAVGAGIVLPGLLWLSLVDGESFGGALLGPGIAIGVGGGLLNTPLATLVTSGVSADDAGAASGLMNTAKQFGGAVGLAGATAASAIAGTDQAAFALMAIAVLLAAATTSAIPRVARSVDVRQHEIGD